jgi:hypothetical protein
MTRRPDPFNQQALEEALHELGCPDSFIATTISNYRLFVPLVLAKLGEDGIYELVCQSRHELGLGEQQTAWRSTIKHIVAWAEASVADYRARRARGLGTDTFEEIDEPTNQLRLL